MHNKSDGSIKFHHRIPGDEVCLLFYKIPQVSGKSGAANISAASSGKAYDQPLGILTLEGGLVKSIYNSVSRVFSPQAEARVSFRCNMVTFICFYRGYVNLVVAVLSWA